MASIRASIRAVLEPTQPAGLEGNSLFVAGPSR